MMLHRRGAGPKEFTLAFNKSKPGWELIKRVTAQGDIENYLMIVTDATVYLSAYGLRDSGSADRDELQTQLEEAE
ncbi:hypothetical protein V2K16_01935 [Pseudomonas alliivorans]|uniref:hypothetical protein n=1 Tax=Pseudomonas alliivorans TaxID=2810613 RepID=UPI001F3CA380|nr:hypothetical protein [Pseudomonas alliivorans]MEE4878043.1 hypothetical protein [Pseudomonas alliivorans]MEE4928414.1 hypothetical protein [Pseudomonas alliivorans]MEE4933829.1 hypothetical protein [Pseudomonas alliivorans]MEE4938961.1 hypothetical protein [Pseudomonas alliivorans]MEE4949930.1 hypothetical protein [Pseudomonas alliivorans]